MNEIRNLLTANRKALQGLHAIANMDFQQPFTIIELTGKFTYNSIMKELGKPDIDETNIFVLYKSTKQWNYGKYYIARITNGKFEVDRKTIKGYETAYGWRWFDTSIGKSDFEENRKSERGHYFIIAQPIQSENKRKNPVYSYARFRLHYNKYTNRPEAATLYDKNGDLYYDNYISGKTFDKSGYIRTVDGKTVNGYERRVAKIKAEKSAIEAGKYDNTADLRAIENRIGKLNAAIVENLMSGKPNYKAIEKISRSIGWNSGYLDRLKENKFQSMTEIQRTLEYLDKGLTEAESIAL